MKLKTLILFFLISLGVKSQNASNYIAVVEGDSLKIELGKDFVYKSKSGKEINFKIIQSDIQRFTNEFVAFNHDKSYNVTCSKIEEGIEQCAVMSSTGTGFLVQSYTNFNPTLLNSIMLNEITKESVNYGYKKTEEDIEITLKSGQKLKGLKADLEYKGETEQYMVMSYGHKDEGILVATIIMDIGDKDSNEELIKVFLNSLEYLK